MPKYIVTITDAKMSRFDSNKEYRSILENTRVDRQEAILARNLLENAPVGAQLHAHFQGRQLAYKNAETNEIITFKNTYVKYKEGCIAVKPIRHSCIGAGAYGQVKLLIDLQTGNHIVAKEFFTGEEKFQTSDRPQLLESYYAKITRTQNLTLPFNGQISPGIVHKQRNPFKKLCQQETIAPLNTIYGDITFSFQITQEQKIAAECIANKKIIANSNAKKNDKDETKPIIYSEYRGYDLTMFLIHNQFLPNDISQLPKLIRESIHILHHAIHAQGLLHCDLKLQNLLLLRNKNSTELSTFICDPDFVVQMNPETKVANDTLKGTPTYFSPELCLYLTEKQCCELIHDGEGLSRRHTISNFTDTLFSHHTNFEDKRNVEYSVNTDTYALGTTWNYFLKLILTRILKSAEKQTSAEMEKFESLQKLISLMTHYHPLARPNLILMQLAILPLEHDALSEATLVSILREQRLPNISLQNLNRLSKAVIEIAKHFDFKDLSPFHFLNWLYQYIQDKLITPENNERDFTKFIEFACFLHKNDPKKYYRFDNALIKLDEFLFRVNYFYHSVETCFFDHMAAFTILMQHNVALRWDHLEDKNEEISDYFSEILRHYTHANQNIQHANQSGKIIYEEIIYRTHNYITNSRININTISGLFSDVKILIKTCLSLKNGKSIWEIISDAAKSEARDEMKLLFELKPLLYRVEDSSLFRKMLLGLAVNLNDLDKLVFVTYYAFSNRHEIGSINSSALFQINPQQLDIYESYLYCTLINCIYLTAKKIARFGDEQLQSDITKLAAFLEGVRNNPLEPIQPIRELQVGAICYAIKESIDLNESNKYTPSQILKNASNILLNNLNEKHKMATEKAAAPPH